MFFRLVVITQFKIYSSNSLTVDRHPELVSTIRVDFLTLLEQIAGHRIISKFALDIPKCVQA